MLENIQEMLYQEMVRLSTPNIDETEIMRSNALSASALTYIKTINVSIRIMEIGEKFNLTKNSVYKQLGLKNEK